MRGYGCLRLFFCQPPAAQAVRSVSPVYDRPLCEACRNQPASHASYVPAFVRDAFIGAGCRYPLYSADARTQFDQHDRDLYACVQCEAEGYFGAEASEEFDGGEWRIILDYLMIYKTILYMVESRENIKDGRSKITKSIHMFCSRRPL